MQMKLGLYYIVYMTFHRGNFFQKNNYQKAICMSHNKEKNHVNQHLVFAVKDLSADSPLIKLILHCDH